MEAKLKRVGDDDPTRCQYVTGRYQCHYQAEVGQKNCTMHGGAKQTQAAETQSLRQYRLAQHQARVNQFADHPKIKSLREEIGIMRLLLEGIMVKCKNDGDLLIYSSKISSMILNIDKVVTSCHAIEAKTGQVLDKTQVLIIVEQIVGVITAYIDDPDLLAALSNDILRVMNETVVDPLSV